ncbi:arsenic resistance protein [Billgrantia gudaonensis]|uniref:Arsenite efflux pump ArsB, ACR3 family n=1 Tax=Billgrantia gudaonensis TaxID=376427 RepID=A0A1G9BU57_9GAMM|nr:bile acid:sodium symporter [Halomonas gudaonensis]SDK42850.1 Arsenite efflux pump ArsB, ACR3 family [Halomonas gudaonensis]
MAILARLTRNLLIAIPLTMVLGLVYGSVAPVAWLTALVVPLTLLMVYPMMVNLKLKQLWQGGDARALGLAQLINFAVIPFVAFAMGWLWFAEQPYLALGLLLAALLPTSGMTISWTGFAKGNVATAIKMTVVGLLLGSLVTPLYVQALMGASIPVDMLVVFRQILLVVGLPLVAGQLTRHYLVGKHGQAAFQKAWAPRFPPLSTLGVLGIVFVAMALKADELLGQPALLIEIAAPLLALYLINFALSTWVAHRFLSRGDGIALVYGTVMRNLSIALALAMNAFGEAGTDAALLVALAYVVQVQAAAWYVRLTPRLFGPAEEGA